MIQDNFRLFIIFFLILLAQCSFAEDRYQDLDFSIEYVVRYDKGSSVKLKTILPVDIPNRQKVEEIIFSYQPTEIVEFGNNKYAIFDMDGNTKVKKINVYVKMRILLSSYSDTPYVDSLELSEEEYKKYTSSESYIESDHIKIREKASTLKGIDAKSTILNIMTFLSDTFGYSYNNKKYGALNALLAGNGSCRQISDLFIALCRANGVASKHARGIILYYNKSPLHTWSEAFIPEKGWVIFDPCKAKTDNSYDRVENQYITLNYIRRDPFLSRKRWYKCEYTGSKPSVSINFNLKE